MSCLGVNEFRHDPVVAADHVYTLEFRKSSRARHLWLTVQDDARVVVTVPRRMSLAAGAQFVERRREWIARQLARNRTKNIQVIRADRATIARDRSAALRFFVERVEHFNTYYGFLYRSVHVRNQRTQWGSCSSDGKLHLNIRLLYLPPLLADYVVVHELCHLAAPNHSPRFWRLVQAALPDYLERRKTLRAYRIGRAH